MIQMNLCTKEKQTHRYRKQTYGYRVGKGGRNGGRDELGGWDWHKHTTIYKTDD